MTQDLLLHDISLYLHKIQVPMKAISLFSCIGVAEYYLNSIGIDVVVASDIDKRRCDVYKYLYPDTAIICGDIRNNETKKAILNAIKGHKIDIVISTPPCQGMSSAGKNRSYSSLSKRNDERNHLILESFDIINAVSPSYILFENVPRILKIRLPYQNEYLTIEQILDKRFGKDYNIKIDILNCCHYDIPQNRERCFIRLYKKGLIWENPVESEHIITLREAIGDLPSLEAGEYSDIKNHWARQHPKEQIEWLHHTPEGCSAVTNPEHYPQKPSGERIKCYANCYKRMVWDAPAPTVTMRNEIMSSQDKVHPGRYLGNGLWSDARVLTLRELLIIMSLPGDLSLPSTISDTALRQFIGEGIPPLMLKKIMQGICTN